MVAVSITIPTHHFVFATYGWVSPLPQHGVLVGLLRTCVHNFRGWKVASTAVLLFLFSGSLFWLSFLNHAFCCFIHTSRRVHFFLDMSLVCSSLP
ncbi:hypothetical protein QR685DRAFT_528818 [Neurospora intermedia]|uniref:Uncharacterized protein n=1 Tax=Neurospora intermedia TaxID=5142 RepID=A0ABR3D948_NEUIN